MSVVEVHTYQTASTEQITTKLQEEGVSLIMADVQGIDLYIYVCHKWTCSLNLNTDQKPNPST